MAKPSFDHTVLIKITVFKIFWFLFNEIEIDIALTLKKNIKP
jgi:hypothetical protein